MFQDALQAMNSLVKEWEAIGIHVWTEEEAILFLQNGQARYLLGGTTTDHAADAFNYEVTQLASSSVSGASTITVEDVTGFVDTYIIGITLDSGDVQWTTISGVPVGDVVTLADTLDDNSSSGNYTFAYPATGDIGRPLKVPEARRLAYQGLLETPMIEYSRQEYMDLPNKADPGIPTAFFYTPMRDQGQLFVWPTPNNVAMSAIRFTWYRSLQDFNTVDNTSDFPQEWVNALTWNLAVELAPDFSVPPQRFQIIKLMADEKLDLVKGWDREAQPIYFTMNYDQTRM